jgi:hypothetical protein
VAEKGKTRGSRQLSWESRTERELCHCDDWVDKHEDHGCEPRQAPRDSKTERRSCQHAVAIHDLVDRHAFAVHLHILALIYKIVKEMRMDLPRISPVDGLKR